MSVPIIVSIGEDALKAVPDSYREAALALGATRWQLVYRVLLPAASNGLLAAVLLGVGRAVGETMAVLMATGHAVHIPTSLLDSVRTLTATIAAELGEAPAGSRPLPGAVPHRDPAVPDHLRRQPDGRPRRPRDPEAIDRGARSSAAPALRATAHVARKERARRWRAAVFAAMTAAHDRAAAADRRLPGRARPGPSLSLGFPARRPADGHDAPAASGRPSSARSTWSASRSLVAAPIGVLAAIYLNEYARDNWFTRVINLAVDQPGRRAEHRPRAVRPRRLRAMPRASATRSSSASLTLAIMTLPVIIASTREALAAVPMAFREACWNVGATRWQTIRAVVLPNSISGILTGVILQVEPRRRRDGADHVHRARCSSRPSRAATSSRTAQRPVHGAVDAPLHARDPGPERARSRCRTPPRSCCSARCCWSTPPPSRCASACAARKKW